VARIRTVKPEFWTDEKTGTLSEFGKCLFLGLLNHADDYGILEWNLVEFRAKIFPYHSMSTHGALQTCFFDEIFPKGLAIFFSCMDDEDNLKKYIFIRHFDRHQVVNRPSKPLIPGWKKGDTPKSYAMRTGIQYQELGKVDSMIPPGALQ
jgi:hypothetical protein